MPLSLLFLVAIIQGITEFLPVSSSGHLALIPLLTDQPYQGRVIDVAAHVGTFFAVALYLRGDLVQMTIGVVTAGRRRPDDMRRAFLLIIATIPAVIIGFIINKIDPAWLLTLETLAIANLVFALLLWLADRYGASLKGITDIRLNQALIIGLVQVCALIPGASRSGVTMTAARFLGFDRLSAARFSLLLSLPVIAGAGTLKTFDMIKTGDLALGMDALIVAILSCLFALIAIRVMMSWLARANCTIFVGYRLVLGALLLLALQAGWLP